MARAEAQQQHRTPALLGSLLLHGGLLAALFVAVKTAPPLHMDTEPVAVSIVSGEPNVSPALQSKAVAPPQAEEAGAGLALPGPEAAEPKPAPAAAAPAPPAREVAPPAPAPTPKPTPRAAPPKPQALDLNRLSHTLAKPQARASLDLDALSKSLPAKAARPSAGSLNLDALADSLPAGRRAGNGARGPARPETATTGRQATGAATSLSGNEVGALTAKLNRLWTLNCVVDGSRSIVVRVRMHLGPDGALAGPPQVMSTTGEASPGVMQAAAQAATSAVRRGSPYDEISANHLANLNDFIVKFDAKSACANR